MPQPNEYMLKQSQAEIEYQKKLTAGTNITIDPVTNTISSAGGGSTVSYESNYTLGDILGRININGTSNAIRFDLRAGDNINIVRDVTTGALVISSTGGSGTITDVLQENESVVEDGIAYTEKNHIILDEDGSLPTPATGNDYDFYASKMERIDPEVTFVKSLVWSDNNDITETSDHVYSYSMTGTSDGRTEMATYSITNLEVGATYQLKFIEQISSSATFYNQHPYGTCISENEDGTGQTKSGDPGTYDPTLRFFSYYRDTDEHEYVCTFEATQETMYLVTVFGDVYDGTSNTVSFSNLTITKVKPEITDLWFKVPSPTGWIKFAGGGASNTSVRILNSKAEWDALPNSKYTDNVIYVIKGSGGRQSVIANPTEPATDTLITIGIDGTVYDIAGSSGGGGSDIEPNPEDEPTDNLEKIRIEDIIYQITSCKEKTTAAYYDIPEEIRNTDNVLYAITDDGIHLGDTFNPVIYSTEEREIGVWTDNKPLYQKTIVTNNPSINTDETISVSDLNIDTLVDIEGRYTRVATWASLEFAYEFNCYEANQYNSYLRYSITNDEIQYSIQLGANETTTYQAFTLQYTKTTDVAGSGSYNALGVPMVHYTTDEQVIGTWVDGKPLYEKTFNGLSQATNGVDWVTVQGVDLPSVKDIINATAWATGGTGEQIRITLAEISVVNNNGIRVSVISSAWNRTINKMTVQYTKTTD